MLQFAIIARDGIDENAQDRRLNVRPLHLDGAKKLKENNQLVLGGALLDESGNMRGSIMIVQFETEEEFKAYLENEPYVKDGVWKDIEVKPFKVANV